MKFEAIIFDLDGTAMPSESNALPSKAMITAVQDNKNKLKLCAATGRSWQMAKSIVKALDLTEPCITSGGTLILDPVKEVALWEERMPLNAVKGVQKIVLNYNYQLIYSEGLQTVYVDDLKSLKLNSPLNILYIMDIPKEIAMEIESRLVLIKDITVSKVRSWQQPNGLDLHITSRKATKEHAVIELCNLLGVSKAEVAGVGDGYNDTHLFNAVGYRVAMGNAVPELKEAADLVIDTVQQDGLAKFIQEQAKNT